MTRRTLAGTPTHSDLVPVAEGATVISSTATGPVARLAAGALGLRPGRLVDGELRIDPNDHPNVTGAAERWQRRIGNRRWSSHMSPTGIPGLLDERITGMRLRFRVSQELRTDHRPLGASQLRLQGVMLRSLLIRCRWLMSIDVSIVPTGLPEGTRTTVTVTFASGRMGQLSYVAEVTP